MEIQKRNDKKKKKSSNRQDKKTFEILNLFVFFTKMQWIKKKKACTNHKDKNKKNSR